MFQNVEIMNKRRKKKEMEFDMVFALNNPERRLVGCAIYDKSVTFAMKGRAFCAPIARRCAQLMSRCI